MYRTPVIHSQTALRGIACLFVLFAHLGNAGLFIRLQGMGRLGVILFFTLSGFLLTLRYRECKTVTEWRDFAVHRFLRIYPLYFLLLLFLWGSYGHLDTAFHMDTENFVRHALVSGKEQILWTVAVECRFYALFPFLILAMAWLNRTRQAWGTGCLTLGWLAVALIPDPGRPYIEVGLLRYLEYFLGGMVAAEAYRLFRQRKPRLTHWSIVFYLSLAATFFSVPRLFQQLTGIVNDIWQHGLIYSWLMGMVVFSAALADTSIMRLWWMRILQRIGEWSYSVYLLHFLVIVFFSPFAPLLPHPYLMTPIILAVSLGLSAATYHWIERSCIAFGKKRFMPSLWLRIKGA